MVEETKSSYGSGYGKRPLWQWILIYLIIGGIIYFAIYYFVFARNGSGYKYGLQSSTNSGQPSYGY